jgi:hypothetical protein
MKVYNDIRWNHDRQRRERFHMVVDSEKDYYLQEWSDLTTSEIVWSKEGQLSDPDIHGQSARRRHNGE